MFPGLYSSECGELDSHGLEEVVSGSHNVNLDVSSTACMQSSWVRATDATPLPARGEPEAKHHDARHVSVSRRLGALRSRFRCAFLAARGKKILTGTPSLKEKHMTATALSRLGAKNFL